jgi:hypothetical protein
MSNGTIRLEMSTRIGARDAVEPAVGRVGRTGRL